jgi:hypothetical protein
MKEFKGTKGDWVNGWGEGLTGPTTPRYPNPTADDNREYTPISIGKETIAIIIQQENNKIEELKANAKLIAAAPVLLKESMKLIQQIKMSNYIEVNGHNIKNNKALLDLEEAINKALN